MIDSDLLSIKKDVEAELFKLKGVVGVGLRNRRIMVYVQEAPIAKHIPLGVEGIPISVMVTGMIYTLARLQTISPLSFAALAGARTDRWRPAPGGVSTGSLDVTAGTIGVLVADTRTGMPLILSNNHVYAQDWGDSHKGVPGKPVIQPGKYDGGTAADQIGVLDRWERVEYKNNVIDAAVARPDSMDLMSNEVLDIGAIYGSMEATEGMPVFKSGRTTALNYSEVTDVNATVQVQGDGMVEYVDQIMTGFMAQGGDSGSMLGTTVPGRPFAVGLLHAGSSKITVHCKWKHIRDLLNVDIGPDLGPWVPPGPVELIGGLAPLAVMGGIVISQEAGKGFMV